MRTDEWANFVLNSHAIENSKFANNFLKYVINIHSTLTRELANIGCAKRLFKETTRLENFFRVISQLN